MPFDMPRSTRAALLIETFDANGDKQVLIYHLSEPIMMRMEQDYPSYNIFDGATRVRPVPAKLTVEAYLRDPTPSYYGGPIPEQEEIQPAQLAIESNESEIIIDEESFDEWQED